MALVLGVRVVAHRRPRLGGKESTESEREEKRRNRGGGIATWPALCFVSEVPLASSRSAVLSVVFSFSVFSFLSFFVFFPFLSLFLLVSLSRREPYVVSPITAMSSRR